MQTFLPYPDFQKTVQCLDFRRLGKQRLEARQILNTLRNGSRWIHHPAVQMWKGYEEALIVYSNACIDEWIHRGYTNTMPTLPVEKFELPWWFGLRKFHRSHKAALLAKDPDWYSQFGWKIKPKIEYVWPTKLKVG